MPTEFRKRRDQARRERTRHRLLDAALRTFVVHGYHRTLVSDIVAEAGVGQGTFYRYFRDKRAILETLLEGLLQQLFDEFSDMSANLPQSVTEYRDASLSAISRAARVVEQNRELCVIFLREAHAVDEEVSPLVTEVYERLARLAGYYLEHAIRAGFARPCDVEIVSRAIVGIGIRTVQAWLDNRYPGVSNEKIVRELVDFAFLGLAPRSDTR